MPESRDRLNRPVDVAAAFARRREGALGILVDDPETNALFGSPMRGSPGATARRVRRGSGNRRFGYGRENMPMRGSASRRRRGRHTSSVLPSYYPRTPLRDITAVVRAIERGRARLREIEAQTMDPVALGEGDRDEQASGALLEPSDSTASQTVGKKRSFASSSKVPEALLKVINENVGDSDVVTPQKKLLDSIEDVEKEVMEDLQKQKTTPSAKRAEREKKVRTLMSMR